MYKSRGALFPILATGLGLLLAVLVPASNTKFISSRRNLKQFETETQQALPVGPNLLFTKRFTSSVFAINWELVVEYQIFNVGDLTAVNVEVHDPDFVDLDSKFAIVTSNATRIQGETVMSGEFLVPSIPPGTNATFNLAVVPLSSKFLVHGGFYKFQTAKVTYGKRNGDESAIGELSSTWSSLSHEKVEFMGKIEAERLYGSKTVDLFLLVLMILSIILIPYVLYKKHSNKYEALQQLIDSRRISKKTKKAKAKNMKNK